MTNNCKNELEGWSYEQGKATYVISQQIFAKLPQFEYWSGSCKPIHHHYGDYGLAKHTQEVIALMFSTKNTLKLDLRNDLIFLAGLFHDIGKLWDYTRTPLITENTYESGTHWIGTPHKRQIHHISRSALVWSKAVDETCLFIDEHDEVLHAILAHHGMREWGSPVSPNSQLAWLLHMSDQTSARLDDCNRWDIVVDKTK